MSEISEESAPKDAGADDVFLTEYQKAQDSAEHHDSLLWTMISIVWAGNLVLIGLVMSTIGVHQDKLLATLLAFLGFVLLVAACVLAFLFASVKNQKYERCKTLEPR